MWLSGCLFSTQGTFCLEGDEMLAVSWLMSSSVMSRATSTAGPSLIWDFLKLPSACRLHSVWHIVHTERAGHCIIFCDLLELLYPWCGLWKGCRQYACHYAESGSCNRLLVLVDRSRCRYHLYCQHSTPLFQMLPQLWRLISLQKKTVTQETVFRNVCSNFTFLKSL